MNRVNAAEDKISNGNGNARYVPNADVISLETIVHMIVNKGICTAEELFLLEGHVQDLNQKDTTNHFVNIQNHYERGRFSALKRLMSKYRWSRHLGTIFFGWKWKKIKKKQS